MRTVPQTSGTRQDCRPSGRRRWGELEWSRLKDGLFRHFSDAVVLASTAAAVFGDSQVLAAIQIVNNRPGVFIDIRHRNPAEPGFGPIGNGEYNGGEPHFPPDGW